MNAMLPYIISNIVAILLLVTALKWPGAARIAFATLFFLASWVIWTTGMYYPSLYQDYVDTVLNGWYGNFIRGWFAAHIPLVAGLIATGQGTIAALMLFRGLLFKIGCAAAIVFLIAILPAGAGSAFPCTAIMAIAILTLWSKAETLSIAVLQEKKILPPGPDQQNHMTPL